MRDRSSSLSLLAVLFASTLLMLSLRAQQTGVKGPAAAAVGAQPLLGSHSAAILVAGGLRFKDLNHNGRLDPYEDWRLPAKNRTDDLVRQMSVDDLAGVMVHGTLPSFGPLGSIGLGTEYDVKAIEPIISARHVNSFITRLTTGAANFAAENNRVQEIAEKTRFGIPVTISSDPRSHFQEVVGASEGGSAFSLWPEPLGFAAIDDVAVTRRFADVVRQEYLAVGIRESLAPQTDLATEPRWARSNGTFGEDAEIARRMTEAYVTGMQNGADGLNPGSVLAVVKHWAGYGAAKDGWDSHNYYGQRASYSGDHFAYHLKPFQGAFDAHVAAVMPTYSILQGVTVDGKPLEQVGAGYNKQLLGGLLRDKYRFSGVVLSDWAITNDCDAICQQGEPENAKPGPPHIGMPWGVERLTRAERFAKAINAGVDQVGGTEESDLIAEDVRKGLIPEARVREAAARVLLEKFEIGLFEQPYVDPARASTVLGDTSFMRDGQLAQARACVLLKNGMAASGKPLLPLRANGTKVYLYGINRKVAEASGLTVVDDAAQADVAVMVAPAPWQTEHPGFFFGSRQHEGRLNFTAADEGYRELLRVSASTPVIFITTLERPLILTEVAALATALVGSFGIADGPLLELLTGKLKPGGHLPFELPSSVAAVERQQSDLPHDSKDPLYRFGFGLTY